MAAMTESEPVAGTDPGVIHNVGLAAIRVGDQSIPSGGRLEVGDVAGLGELPVDAYVVRKPSTSAEAPQAAEEAPKRRRAGHAADEPTTPAPPADTDAATGAEEPTP